MGRTLVISHTPPKIGGCRHCVSIDIMVLVCHMTFQDHVTKGSSNMGRSSSGLVTILASLVVIGTLVVEM